MRDPKRIQTILTLLNSIWARHPDMRLGQILVNATGHNKDMFYYEDDQMIKDLEELIVQCNHSKDKRK